MLASRTWAGGENSFARIEFDVVSNLHCGLGGLVFLVPLWNARGLVAVDHDEAKAQLARVSRCAQNVHDHTARLATVEALQLWALTGHRSVLHSLTADTHTVEPHPSENSHWCRPAVGRRALGQIACVRARLGMDLKVYAFYSLHGPEITLRAAFGSASCCDTAMRACS